MANKTPDHGHGPVDHGIKGDTTGHPTPPTPPTAPATPVPSHTPSPSPAPHTPAPSPHPSNPTPSSGAMGNTDQGYSPSKDHPAPPSTRGY